MALFWCFFYSIGTKMTGSAVTGKMKKASHSFLSLTKLPISPWSTPRETGNMWEFYESFFFSQSLIPPCHLQFSFLYILRENEKMVRRCSWCLIIQIPMTNLCCGRWARISEKATEQSEWSITFAWTLMLLTATKVFRTAPTLCSGNGTMETTSCGRSKDTVSSSTNKFEHLNINNSLHLINFFLMCRINFVVWWLNFQWWSCTVASLYSTFSLLFW